MGLETDRSHLLEGHFDGVGCHCNISGGHRDVVECHINMLVAIWMALEVIVICWEPNG